MAEPTREENFFTGSAMALPEQQVTRLNEIGLGVEELSLAREISSLANGGPDKLLGKALTIIILATLLSTAEGNTRLALRRDKLPGDLCNNISCDPLLLDVLTKLFSWFREAESSPVRPEIANVVGKPGDYKPLIVEQGWLYTQKMYVLENRVAKTLKKKLQGKLNTANDKIIKYALQEVIKQPLTEPGGVKTYLDSEQILALETALGGKVAIISGRPGSGKTSIVTSLLRVLFRIGIKADSIALAAPTGKAADRLRLSIARQLTAIKNFDQADRELALSPPPASTIHRLLGYSPSLDSFQHNANNPLLKDLVIVDESSMLDLYLTDRLLQALKDDTALILLGDADQLPSINTGAILRDLCNPKLSAFNNRVAVLEKSYRVQDDPDGLEILSLAEAVNRGQTFNAKGAYTFLKKRSQAAELSFRGTELLVPSGTGARTDFYQIWLDKLQQDLPDLIKLISEVYRYGTEGFDEASRSALEELFRHYEKFRILCVTRLSAGGAGSEPVNEWFHHRWQDILNRNGLPSYHSIFYSGEPVMIISNDYRLNLYNGDSGIILNIAIVERDSYEKPSLMAVFPHGDTFTAYPLTLLRGRLETSWATTVHKAQGSEYDHIALLLPDQPVRPLTRELIYTAVTRAKKSVLIHGTKQVLQEGINQAYERTSGLTDRLL